MPRWDKEKVPGLDLRGQGRARSLEDVQRELEGLVFGSDLSQTHLTAEEYCSSCKTVFSAGNTLTSGKTRRHSCRSPKYAGARKAVVHSPVDPVALVGILRAGFLRTIPTNIVCPLARPLCTFKLHAESWMCSHVEIYNDPRKQPSPLLRQPRTR